MDTSFILTIARLATALGCKVGAPVLALYQGVMHSHQARIIRCALPDSHGRNSSSAHRPDARCWKRAMIKSELDMDHFEVEWDGSTCDGSPTEMCSKASSRVAKWHAMHLFDFHTMRCDHVQSVPSKARWSPDFIADVLADPHPLCFSSGTAHVGQRLAAEVKEIVQDLPFEFWLIGGGNRQPAGHRQLHPYAPPLDPFFLSFNSGVTVTRAATGAVVGATVHLSQEPYILDGLPKHNWRMGNRRETFVILGMNPRVIQGRSFLELAAADGMNCFHAEWLGATDVMCLDYIFWGGGHEDPVTYWQGWPGNTEPLPYLNLFKAAHCLRQSNVQAMRINVYDISPEVLGRRFDIVRAFGLLYHLKHPLVALEALSQVTLQALVFETEALLSTDRSTALCQWCRGSEFANDPSNFFICDNETLTDWLHEVGYVDVFMIQNMSGTIPEKFATMRAVYVAIKPGASVTIADFQDYG